MAQKKMEERMTIQEKEMAAFKELMLSMNKNIEKLAGEV